MIIYRDIQQRTPEWFELKWGKVGGSTSKGLFIPSDTLMLEILAEVTEPFEIDADGYCSPEMQRGIDLEPIGRAELEKVAKVSFIDVGWLQCEENDLLGISPDGITDDGLVSCEGKCPGRKKHIETVLSDRIPVDNIHQCLHYFTVNPKLQKHYFFSFRPESDYPFWYKLLTRDSEIDLGTKAKPNAKTVQEWVDIAKVNAKALKDNLQIAIKQLNKI